MTNTDQEQNTAKESLLPYQQPISTVTATFVCNPETGLSSEEAQQRLLQHGPNLLPAKPPVPAWKKFLGQFADPLTILLLVAMAISLLAWIIENEGGWPFETLTILIIVVLNAVLGFMQEQRAEEAVAALQAMSAPTARVLRDQMQQSIAAHDLVPGDILLVEEGDTLPADARVMESIALHVAEATLTGESAPVSKDPEPIHGEAGIGDQENMLFSGTAVTSGRGRAIVTSTGAATEIGRIAQSLQTTADEPSPLQKELEKVGRMLGRTIILIAIIMGITLLWLNRAEHSLSHFVSILMFAVSLAVAAVPEGLTAINTIILSLGMARMAKRNVIVRKLNSVETLGSTTVICSDKTGTLTRNEMTVRVLLVDDQRIDLSGIGYAPEGELSISGEPLADGLIREETLRLLRCAELANNANLIQEAGHWLIQGDPTEAALIVAARKAGITHEHLSSRFRRIHEMPFTSERKMMSIGLYDSQHPGHLVVAAKGAPDVLLARCSHEWRQGTEQPLTPARRVIILAQIESLAHEALRTLGVASRLLRQDAVTGELREEHETDMVFLGVIGMMDPPRTEAIAAVREAQTAGIRTVMITGDHPVTAAAIAAEIGISNADTPAVTGAELQRLDEAGLRAIVGKASVYARVAPEHKLRIVSALQAEGAISAMTGDGVNDAPALKKADIGVAMGITGTDVSKGAADMILTDDNFASIVAAVEEGRTIFANIQKFLRFLLSSNMGEVFFMFFGVLLAGIIGLKPEVGTTITVPLLAVQILWVNLLTDSGPALALGVDPVDPDIMNKPPRDPRSSVIDRPMWFDIFYVGLIMAFGTLLVTDWILPGGLIAGGTGDISRAQTMAFTTLVFFQLFNAFNARSDEQSAFHQPFSNAWLWFAIGLAVVLQIAVVHVPFLQTAFKTEALSWQEWGVCIAVSSSVLWLMELKKILIRKRASSLAARMKRHH